MGGGSAPVFLCRPRPPLSTSHLMPDLDALRSDIDRHAEADAPGPDEAARTAVRDRAGQVLRPAGALARLDEVAACGGNHVSRLRSRLIALDISLRLHRGHALGDHARDSTTHP